MVTKTNLNSDIIEVVKDATIIGGENLVQNPNLNINTNFWAASNVVPTITASGIQLVGSGIFYQIENTSDVVNGTAYMARAYVNTASGTWRLMVGTSTEASTAGAVALTTGWNSFRFTAGSANYLQLYSSTAAATDTLVVSPIEIREQKDLEIAGQIRNLDIEYGDVYFSSGTAAAPSISFESDKDTGIFLNSIADMRLGASGIAQLAIKGSATHVLSALIVGGSATVASAFSMQAGASVVGSINAVGGTFTSGVAIGSTWMLVPVGSTLTLYYDGTVTSNVFYAS